MPLAFQRFGILVSIFLSFATSVALAVEEPTFTTQTLRTKHSTGLVRTQKSESFFKTSARSTFSDKVSDVPQRTSLRGLAGPVEDQGQCGSCWDFSLTSVLRGSLLMSGADPGRLSFNYLLNCAQPTYNCSGGDFDAADYLLHPKGVPAYGADGTYSAQNGSCHHAKAIASTKSYKLLGSDGGLQPGAPTPSFKDIAYVIGVLRRPVATDINATDSFQNYASGVYNDCTDSDITHIDHMVSIEGYDCESSVDAKGNCVFDAKGNLPPGVGTWLIRNSWGRFWGDNGYVTMKATNSQGKRCNSVANDALYFTVR